jgi:hypothetical protein
MRSQPIEVTLATLLVAKAAGVGAIIFTSDNFNQYPKAADLLETMIEEWIWQARRDRRAVNAVRLERRRVATGVAAPSPP